MKFPRVSSAAAKIAVSLLFFAVGSVICAEEIIYFTNGTAMPIISHAVVGKMIHVDLGSNGKIAFPERNVERIEQAGKDVYLKPSSQMNGGVLIDSARGANTAYPAGGYATIPRRDQGAIAKNRRGLMEKRAALNDPTIEKDAAGLAIVRPNRNHRNPAMRQFGATGNFANRSSRRSVDGSVTPTTAIGNHRRFATINPPRGYAASKGGSSTLALRDGTAPRLKVRPPPDPPADQ